MLRVITLNANGIRAARRKGLFGYLARARADVVCIQETRAQPEQLAEAEYHPPGCHVVYNSAERKGYSGTALYSRVRPRQVTTRLGWEPVDGEGRYIQADYDGLSVVSLYMPSGSSGEAAQEKKFRFMDNFFAHLKALRRKRREFIICADWNICHREIDLKNWKANQKNSGFLPEERAWLDRVYGELKYIDSFRVANPEPEQYTWWSNRGQAWAKNVGWRLDYQIITPGLAERVRTAAIYKAERFSDHAPQIMEFDWELAP